MSRLRIAVIGVGHLGKEHARILSDFPDVELVGVADVDFEQAQTIARRCRTRAFADYWPLLNLVDAAVIAVPTTYHHAIGCEFLKRQIPLLIEKPLALSVEQSGELLELSRAHDVLLQVGHIERFNPAFQELAAHPLRPKFIACERLGPFSGRSTDIGVVLDLMIHDLDLVLTLVQAPVLTVDALGVSVFGGHEDVANARLVFADGCVATLTASRASTTAVRRMNVWASEGYAGIDLARRSLTLVQPSEELRRLRALPGTQERSFIKKEMAPRYLQALHLERKEGDQLTAELREFVASIRRSTKPRVGGAEGHEAIALAARILESIRSHAWNGAGGGPVGPFETPAPLGDLFKAPHSEAA